MRPQAVGLLLILLVLSLSMPAIAQIHHLDDMPWHALADSMARRGAAFSWHQFHDGDTDWRTDRLGIELLVPFGERAVFVVQAGFLRFDSAELLVFDRWPHLREAAEDGTSEVSEDWPGQSMVNGFDRPELGLLVPLKLPVVGQGGFGLLVGLPVGRDELYPMSSASIPIRLDWRRPWSMGSRLAAAVRVGYEHTLSSSREKLHEEAFPSGFRYGVELSTDRLSRRGVGIEWAARELSKGRHSRRLRLTGWIPLQEGHTLELSLGRELGGKADRYATWILGISWRFGGLTTEELPSAED